MDMDDNLQPVLGKFLRRDLARIIGDTLCLLASRRYTASKMSSLIQGYSSSEEEVDNEQNNARSAVTTSERDNDDVFDSDDRTEFKTLPSGNAFPPLPSHKLKAPANKRTRAPLPLLEDEVESLESDASSTYEDEDILAINGSRTKVDHGLQRQTEPVEHYQSDLISTNGTLRKRQVLDIDDELEPVSVPRVPMRNASVDTTETAGERPFSISSSRRDDSSDWRANLKQKRLGDTMRDVVGDEAVAQELRKARASGATFTELSSSQIRADAQQFQQGGITVNLHKSRGVTGRQNQISYLAQVALKQKEESK